MSAWCLRYIYTGVVSNETQEISLRPKHRNFVRSCGVLVTGTWYANTVTSASQHVSGNKWVSTWTCVANCFMSGHQTNFTTSKDVTQLASGSESLASPILVETSGSLQVLCSSTSAYAGDRLFSASGDVGAGRARRGTAKAREGPGGRVNSSHGLLPFAAP